MIHVSEALRMIEHEAAALGSEQVALSDAEGRILGEDIVADMDLPPFDRSQMDGFAVRADDVKIVPVELKIVGESAAGHGWHHELKSGEAVRIMTGAPVPEGADTVQKVELTSEASFSDGAARETVTLLESVEAARNIVPRGAEIVSGQRVLQAGERVNDRMIAVLAAFGYEKVLVGRRPRVAILTTGSEVVEISEKPGTDQIRNSNAPMLRTLVTSTGGDATMLPSVSDELDAIKSTISDAIAINDAIVITGGVSVGKYDLTKRALAELGAAIHFDKLRLKPGKPMVFATLGKTLIFGLPGNPVSAVVTYYLFVRKALLIMQSAHETDLSRGRAIARGVFKAASERDTYLPARLKFDEEGRLVATPLKWLGSSDFIGFARADALVLAAAGTRIENGEVADMFLI